MFRTAIAEGVRQGVTAGMEAGIEKGLAPVKVYLDKLRDENARLHAEVDRLKAVIRSMGGSA